MPRPGNNKKLTIVIDLRPLMGGRMSGVEVYLYHLLTHLLEMDKKNTYILFANASKKQNFHSLPLRQKNIIFLQTRIPNKLLNLSLSFFRRPKLDEMIIKKLRKIHHVDTIDLFFMPDLRLSALTKNVKKITVVHDLSFHHFPEFFSKKTQLWYHMLQPKREILLSDTIITVSNATKKDLEKSYKIPSKKIKVIYEGVEEVFGENISKEKILEVKNTYRLPENYFLFLATLEPRKNMERLIKAFKIFRQKNPNQNIKLVMAGLKNEKIFSAVQLAQDSTIIFTGFIEEKDKAAVIKGAVAFLYPSLFEGFGLPLLEAMKCNVPIITSNTSSMPEITNDAALCVNPWSVMEISKAMKEILKPEMREKLQKAMKIQIKKFTWQQCAKETLELFQKVSSRSF